MGRHGECGPRRPAADAWLSDFLSLPCRLVRFADELTRPVDPTYALPSDHTAFADGFPFLLISQGSLDDLNARLETPVPMIRFRPNLVVGLCPFAEDDWKRIRIGTVTFRVAKPCSRCAIPTVDPQPDSAAASRCAPWPATAGATTRCSSARTCCMTAPGGWRSG